jgi:hypothetical protein
MAIVLDLIGSFIVAAFAILLGLRMNVTISEHLLSSTTILNVQEGLDNAVETLETDFRKIGYGVTDPRMAIEISQPTHIRFKADMDRNGTVDHVDLRLVSYMNDYGDTLGALVRQINSEMPIVIAGEVMDFSLSYLTQGGTPADTTVKSQIWIIESTLRIKSPYKVTDQVVGSDRMKEVEGFWRQTRLASRNLKRHG